MIGGCARAPFSCALRFYLLKPAATEGTMRFFSLRALFLLGFVVAMPVLALPPVARWMDELLYGVAPADFGRPPLAASQTTQPPLMAERVVPAIYDEASPATAPRGLDAPPAPPALAPVPAFAPVAPPAEPAALPSETKIDERVIARLQQVRQRLEELGAEYVMAETVDGGARYRFHCRMLVDNRSRFTRPFEATSFDPIAAADQVLRDVETWRTAAKDAAGRTQ
jgi:hypothetical protein